MAGDDREHATVRGVLFIPLSGLSVYLSPRVPAHRRIRHLSSSQPFPSIVGLQADGAGTS
jgi:hypothetical protein